MRYADHHNLRVFFGAFHAHAVAERLERRRLSRARVFGYGAFLRLLRGKGMRKRIVRV